MKSLQRWVAPAAMFVMVATAACDLPFAPKQSRVDVSNGRWVGTTNQGKPIAFTVQGDIVTELTLTHVVTTPGCAVDATDTVVPKVAIKALIAGNGAFDYIFHSPSSGLRLEVTGWFQDRLSATGDLIITPSCGAVVRATWVANRDATALP